MHASRSSDNSAKFKADRESISCYRSFELNQRPAGSRIERLVLPLFTAPSCRPLHGIYISWRVSITVQVLVSQGTRTRSESGTCFKNIDKSLKISSFSLSQRRSRSEWNVTICCDLIVLIMQLSRCSIFRPVFNGHEKTTKYRMKIY